MTQLMGRPILSLPTEPVARSALTDLLAGVRIALLTLSVVAVPVLGLWVLAPYGDDTAAGAGRFACALWLLGHGAPLTRGTGAAPVTVTPLLLTALDAVLLHRAGRRIARQGRRRLRAPIALAAGYLAVAACAVAACGGADPGPVLRARPLPDLLAVALLTAGSLALGLRRSPTRSAAGQADVGGSAPVRVGFGRAGFGQAAPGQADLGRDFFGQGVFGRAARGPEASGLAGAQGVVPWARWVPDWAWAPGGAAVAGRAAAMWLLGLATAGGVLVTVAVVLGEAGRSVRALGGGIAGVLGLLLACVLLLPNAVLWAAAYALGPGFEVGAGSVAAPTGTQVGAVPEFPLLALVPGSGGAGWWLLVGVLPVAAGVLPARLLGRAAGERGWRPAALAAVALLSAAMVGGGTAVAAWAAGGALAGGRMAQLGPVPWLTAPAAVGWVLLVTLPVALLATPGNTALRYLRWRTAQARVALHGALTRLANVRLGRASS